jgi:hypothetical protein
MATAAEQVDAAFTKATVYANEAKSSAAAFLSALDAAIYTPPTLSVTWESIAAPTLPTMPTAPTLPTIEFNAPGTSPAPLALSEPTVTIDDFTETAPTVSLPTAPTVSYGSVPTIPTVADVTIPTAPTLPTVSVPSFLSLTTITTPTIDLRESWLDNLDAIPTLSLLEPTPYSYARGPEYVSTLLGTLKAKLNERATGGSGLPPAVEAAIWDRLRDRETAVAQANIDEIARQSDALGYALPAGVIVAQTRDAQQAYYDKLSESAREVAIKQADLEQSNVRDAIAAGIQLEGQLITYSFNLERLTFDTAKQYADNALQLYNAAIERFRALLDGYNAYAVAYKTIIDGQLAKVETFKAQLQGEQTKAEINNSLVQQYKAQIEAGLAQVEIYRAQVGGAQTLLELERTKIGAAGEQIRAYVAQINGETAKVEAYKAVVQAEVTKVDVYRAKVGAFQAKVGAQAERARADVTRYSALYQAKASEWEGYRALVMTESERIRALGLQSGSQLDAYRATVASITSQAEQQAAVWRANIAQYEAGQNIAIQTARLNNDATISANNARLDAAKTGAQIYAQLTSSAYSMINASAGISGSGSTSVSYSYSNDTTSAVTPVTAA